MDATDADIALAAAPAPAGKSRLLAVLLQCLPMLFTGGCVASTFGPAGWYRDAPGTWFYTALALFAFAWGFGYLYLGQRSRFVRALGTGVLLAFLAWWLNLVLLDGCIDLGTREQCGQHVRVFDRPFALLTAGVVGFWVVLYARDAFTLSTALGRGRPPEETGGRSFVGRIAVSSTVIGFAMLAFYISPVCGRLWDSTR